MSKIEVYNYSDTKLILFEIGLTIIAASAFLAVTTKIHVAICISISVILGIILFNIFRTKIGFWIVTLLFSSVWAFVSGSIAYEIANKDTIWRIVVGIFAFLISLSSHSLARRFYDNVTDA